MALRGATQLPHERDAVVRAPSGYGQPAALGQRAAHLLRSSEPVTKELEALLTYDDVELLCVVERQRAGIAFAPIDIRRHCARNRKHIRADIDADDVCGISKPFFRRARQYSRTASKVEDPVVGRE